MDFGKALEALKAGKKVTRTAWESDHAFLVKFHEEESDKDLLGWSSDNHPQQVYHPSADDLLAEDWQEVQA